MSDYVLVGFVLWLVMIILACACVLAFYMGVKRHRELDRLFGTVVPAEKPRNIGRPRLPR